MFNINSLHLVKEIAEGFTNHALGRQTELGGYTPTERSNRLALIEDSVLATKQAMLGGYIAVGVGIGGKIKRKRK